jgi:hypothetical protein
MKMTRLAAGTLLASAAFALPAPSGAQVQGDRNGDADTYRIGYDRGFADGLEHGVKDGPRGDGYSLIHDKRYRRGDAGYKKSYGPRQDYITGYRDGYEQAVRRGDGVAGRDDPYDYGRGGRDREDRALPSGSDDDYDDVIDE